jgi:hypothetical protein
MDPLDKSLLRIIVFAIFLIGLSYTPLLVYGQGIEPQVEDQVENAAEQNGDLNSNTQNSNNNNKTTTNIGAGAGEPTPVNTAIAPSLMSSGSDSCLRSKSSALQALTIGLSGGYYIQDEECNRRRDAKVFKDLGMSIAAVSRMCQNEDNWLAMFMSGTPCPILVGGKMVFGKNAVLAMKTNPQIYIPDYTDKKDFYNNVLGIGREEDVQENTDSISISERFRRSTKSDTDG